MNGTSNAHQRYLRESENPWTSNGGSRSVCFKGTRVPKLNPNAPNFILFIFWNSVSEMSVQSVQASKESAWQSGTLPSTNHFFFHILSYSETLCLKWVSKASKRLRNSVQPLMLSNPPIKSFFPFNSLDALDFFVGSLRLFDWPPIEASKAHQRYLRESENL